MRHHRFAAALAALALVAPACTAPGSAGSQGPPTPTGGGSEFRDSHHARLQGSVTSARGVPLEAVEVVTLRLVDPSQGSLAQHRVRTDAAGRFFLPVALIAAGGTDTATVEVEVRATAFPPRYPRPTSDTYYTTSTRVAVRVVPVSREPTVVSVQLVLPIP